MKVISSVILYMAVTTTVLSYPSGKQIGEEIEIVPLEDQYGRQPIVDTGVVGGPFSSLFDDPFGGIPAMMLWMRQQVNSLLRIQGNSTNDPFRGGLPSGIVPFPNIPDLDLGKGNTTSVTKVIDGHKVVINETEYKQDGDFGGTYFKVRVIDVLPDSDEATSTNKDAEVITSGPPKDTEPLENSQENEISKTKQSETSTDGVSKDVESMDETDAPSSSSVKLPSKSEEWNKLEGFESFEDNSIDSVPGPNLKNDIYVNTLLANSGASTNPDAEIFSNSEVRFPYFESSSRPKFEKFINPR